MATRSVRVTGVAETRAAFARIAQQIKAGAQQATDQASEDLADDMRQRVPVLSGELQDGIAVQDAGDGVKEVGPMDVDHALYVEYGTSVMDAQPYAQPASEVTRQQFPGQVAESVKRALP